MLGPVVIRSPCPQSAGESREEVNSMQRIRFDNRRLLGFRLESRADATLGANGGAKAGNKRPPGQVMGAKLGCKGGSGGGSKT
jgi:hypothetical protein